MVLIVRAALRQLGAALANGVLRVSWLRDRLRGEQQPDGVVGERRVLSAADRDHLTANSDVHAGSAHDRDVIGRRAVSNRRLGLELTALESERAQAGADRVLPARGDRAGRVQDSSVLARAREQLGREGEQISRRRPRLHATRRVVDKVERAVLLDQMKHRHTRPLRASRRGEKHSNNPRRYQQDSTSDRTLQDPYLSTDCESRRTVTLTRHTQDWTDDQTRPPDRC